MKHQEPRMGSNRTGVQMSPLDARRMHDQHVEAAPAVLQLPAAAAGADVRARYIADAGTVGSVPPPGSVKGVLNTGVAMLSGNNPQLLLDRLGERLAFERTATRICDALITKVRTLQGDDGDALVPLDILLSMREQEAEHFALVARCVEQLGGDSTAQTPAGDLAGVESSGLLQAVADPRTSVAQSLHALLISELADNSGWEMLVALAAAHKHTAMLREFERALERERAHLQYVKAWFERHTLGAPAAPEVPGGAHWTAPDSR